MKFCIELCDFGYRLVPLHLEIAAVDIYEYNNNALMSLELGISLSNYYMIFS